MNINTAQFKPLFMAGAMIIAIVAALKLFGVTGLPIRGSLTDIAAVAAICAWLGR